MFLEFHYLNNMKKYYILSPLSKVWKYERGNQKPVTEEQTIQLPKRKNTKWQTIIYKILHRIYCLEAYKNSTQMKSKFPPKWKKPPTILDSRQDAMRLVC